MFLHCYVVSYCSGWSLVVVSHIRDTAVLPYLLRVPVIGTNYLPSSCNYFLRRVDRQSPYGAIFCFVFFCKRGFAGVSAELDMELLCICFRIDDRNQVKVADFGLSHQLFEREYYSSRDRKAKLPIKWMALESLEDFVFTAKSDVVRF